MQQKKEEKKVTERREGELKNTYTREKKNKGSQREG